MSILLVHPTPVRDCPILSQIQGRGIWGSKLVDQVPARVPNHQTRVPKLKNRLPCHGMTIFPPRPTSHHDIQKT